MKILALVTLVTILCASFAAPQEDLVNNTQLTGAFSQYQFPIYSGYLKVNDTKYHHYIFFPSQNNPTTDPVLLWLNGGPGCSSMLGFLYEHGPYYFPDNSTTLLPNPYSWNLNASVIYMESPAVVGYSYAGGNYAYDDNSTAADNLAAMLDWFSKFPEYKNNEFYISGESYAGVYVPTLAYKIDRYNVNAPSGTAINLKGFAVGNALTDFRFDVDMADMDFYWNHDMYSPPLRQEYEANCGGVVNPANPACNATLNKVYNITQNLILNIYDIFRPCYYMVNGTDAVKKGASFDYLRFKRLIKNNIVPDRGNTPGAPKCVDSNGSYIWLNDPQNVAALHIRNPVTGEALNKTWYMCVMDDAELNYTPGQNASYWVYQLLVNKGYKMMVYSGNTDASVPTIGTKRWLEQLRKDQGLAMLKEWTKFYLPGEISPLPQLAGYYQIIQGGITFVQVNGVGHMVPQWQRPAGKKILDNLLQGVPF